MLGAALCFTKQFKVDPQLYRLALDSFKWNEGINENNDNKNGEEYQQFV